MRITAFSLALLSVSGTLVFNSERAVADEVLEKSLPASMPGASAPFTPPSATDLATAPVTEKTAKPSTRSRIFSRPGAATPVFTRPMIEPQVTSQTKQALGFYGGYAARATLSAQPRRTPIQASAARPLFRQAKPFQSVYHEPTVSPYLNLHRDDANAESAPNYFAFVRPQLDQIDANRAQQREIQQLRGQLQSAATVVGPQFRASGLPGTGTPARYMDTAQFYGGLRR